MSYQIGRIAWSEEVTRSAPLGYFIFESFTMIPVHGDQFDDDAPEEVLGECGDGLWGTAYQKVAQQAEDYLNRKDSPLLE